MRLQDKKIKEILSSRLENRSSIKSDTNVKIDVEKFAKSAYDVLDDKKIEDIVVLELDKSLGLADYFIIATASSNTQMKAALDSVYRELKNEGITPYAENQNSMNSVWFLLDYGFMVIHLFTKEGREYYELEKLWNDAKKLEFSRSPKKKV